MSIVKGDHISSLSSIPSNPFNHWDDAFVQSIQTSYGGSEYRERLEKLVSEAHILLNEMHANNGDDDLIERLEMVDVLQCLGIDRYFGAEIKEFLDYVYRAWNKSVGIGLASQSSATNLNSTALGLRLLRLHRYDVSADTLQKFMDNNGHFMLWGRNNDENENNSKEENMMRSMLNLLRVSCVAFPGEFILEQAKMFSSGYLKNLLENSEDIYSRSFLREVEYALVYEWRRTFSRWEARNFIEIYELDNQRLKDKRILELGKLDFNILQFQYKLEMKNLSSWWTKSGISKLISTRERTIEFFFWAVGAIEELELSSSRIALSKITTVVTIMDDIFDDYATPEQLKCIVESIGEGWDLSIIESIPRNLKACVDFIFKTIHELGSDATKKQGRDMMPFITKAWEDYAKASLEQAQWKATGYFPTYDEYMKFAEVAVGFGQIVLHTVLLASKISCNDDIEKIYLNTSRFYKTMRVSFRLIDDIHDFEDEKIHGKIATAVSCYMGDHPNCSEGEALNCLTNMNNELLKEVARYFFDSKWFFHDWEKICVNITRVTQFVYIYGDGFTYCEKEIKHQMFKVLVDPIEI